MKRFLGILCILLGSAVSLYPNELSKEEFSKKENVEIKNIVKFSELKDGKRIVVVRNDLSDITKGSVMYEINEFGEIIKKDLSE